jgi:transposase InsO family protein
MWPPARTVSGSRLRNMDSIPLIQPVTADHPAYHMAIDLAGPLPETPRHNIFLLVLVCLFTRFCFLRAIPNKAAATIAAVLFSIFCEIGFPAILQSANGSEFVNDILKELIALINAAHRLITPYNARANGVAERWVQLAVRAICKCLEGAETDWDLVVPGTQLALNTRVITRFSTLQSVVRTFLSGVSSCNYSGTR